MKNDRISAGSDQEVKKLRRTNMKHNTWLIWQWTCSHRMRNTPWKEILLLVSRPEILYHPTSCLATTVKVGPLKLACFWCNWDQLNPYHNQSKIIQGNQGKQSKIWTNPNNDNNVVLNILMFHCQGDNKDVSRGGCQVSGTLVTSWCRWCLDCNFSHTSSSRAESSHRWVEWGDDLKSMWEKLQDFDLEFQVKACDVASLSNVQDDPFGGFLWKMLQIDMTLWYIMMIYIYIYSIQYYIYTLLSQ